MSKSKAHILIVDDDSRILKLLKKFLTQNGYLVSISLSSAEATEILKNFEIDLMILDVMMPNVTGLEYAKEIKATGSSLPIIMLTALSEPEDVVTALEAGANDYMTKPFNPKELLLRIANLLQTRSNYKKFTEEEIVIGDVTYDQKKQIIFKDKEITHLTESEAKILSELISEQENVISRQELAKRIGLESERSIDVQINRLRNKIEQNPSKPQYLKTVRSVGYILYIK